MGILTDLNEMVDLSVNGGVKPSNHSANTSVLYAYATNKWANTPVAQAFAEAEQANGKPELNSIIAEKYSSVGDDLPQGVIQGFINPKEAVALQSQIQADISDPELVTDLGSEAMNTGNQNKEKLINMFAEWSHKNEENTGYGDYAWTFTIPNREQALLLEAFGTADANAIKNLSSAFRSSNGDDQVLILKQLLHKFDSISGYHLEKQSVLQSMFQGYDDLEAGLTNKLGALDGLLTATGSKGVYKAAKGLIQLKRDTSVVETLKRAGDAEEAGKAASAAIQDPNVAKRNLENVDDLKAGIISNDRVKAVGSTNTVADLGGTGVVVTDINKEVNEISQRIANSLDDLILSENFSVKDINPLLKDPEGDVAPLKQMAMAEFQKTHIKIANDGAAPVPTATIKHFDEHTGEAVVEFKFEGNVTGTKVNKDGTLSKRGVTNNKVNHTQTTTIRLGSDIHDTLEKFGADVTTSKHFMASPKYKFEGINGTTVNRIVENQGLDQRATEKFTSVVQGEFVGALKKAGLTKKSPRRAHFEHVLKKLDGENRLAKVDELIDVHKFDKKQVEAYYSINKINDVLKQLHDHTNFRKALLNGTKSVSVNGSKLTGRAYDKLTSARNALKEAQYLDALGEIRVKSVWDNVEGRYFSLEALPDMAGKKFVVLDDDVVVKIPKTRSSTKYLSKDPRRRFPEMVKDMTPKTTRNTRLMIVAEEDIGDLTREAMKTFQRKSYIPIYRPDAKYFVKETSVRNVDGLDIEYDRTAAGFDNKIDAEAYLARRKQDHADGKLKDVKSVHKDIFYDRESHLGGGFSDQYKAGGARASKHEIEWMGVTDKTRMNPIEAISRNINNVASKYINNEWRLSVLKKWQNSVKEIDPKHSGHINDGVNTATQQGRNLEEMRRYIKSKFGIPTDETMAWEGFTRRVAEWLDLMPVVGKSSLSRAIRRAGNHDPYSYLKYASYQTMLGMFNPAQLVVQAQNMTLAMSLYPKTTMATMGRAMALKWHMGVDYKTIDALNKAGKLSDETVAIIKQFRRAGLDNVNTNADIDIAAAGFGTTRSAMKRALEAGTVFYRNGELASRSVLYNVAWSEYMKLHKIKNWKNLTEKDYRNIVEMFDNLSINLNSNNKAMFQQGALSVPTQFWHVQTKFVEALLGKNFTRQDKLKLLVGQGVLYGAAGVPGGYFIADFLQKRNPDGSGQVLGFDQETFRGGLMNWLFDKATGSGVQIAQRGALAYDLERYFEALWKDDNKELWQHLMGASGELFRRGSYAWNITKAFAVAGDDTVNEPDLIDMIVSWGSIASSIANADSAFDMMAINAYRDKYSNRINFKDPTVVEVFAKAAGFSSTREANIWEDATILRKYSKWKVKKANQFFQVMRSKHIDIATEAGADWLKKSVPAYAQLFGGGNPRDVEEIQKTIFRKLKDITSKEEKIHKQVIKLIGTSDLASMETEEDK